MMVPSISPFPVLLKCGMVRSSPPHSGPLLLSYCLRAAGKGGSSIYKIELCSGGYFIFSILFTTDMGCFCFQFCTFVWSRSHRDFWCLGF